MIIIDTDRVSFSYCRILISRKNGIHSEDSQIVWGAELKRGSIYYLTGVGLRVETPKI